MSTVLLRNVRLGVGREPADVLLRGGRVAAIATDLGRGAPGLSVEDMAGVEVLETDGSVLLPGLVDAHVHLSQWAAVRRRIDVRSASSSAEVVSLLGDNAPAGDDLVLGHGFRDALWTLPAHRDLLDARFPARPVVVVSADLHAVWLNSAAAREFGVGGLGVGGLGVGELGVGELGVGDFSGVLRERAAMELTARAGDVGDATLDAWILEATRAAAARGVTSIVDLEYAPISAWARRERPAVRVAAGVWPDWIEAAITDGLVSGVPVPGADERVRVGPLKLLVDGSLGTRTAFCQEAYPSGGNGILRILHTELEPALRRATAHGFDVAVHAIGDAAVRVALDGFAAVGCTGTLEHAQQVADEDLPRFAELGVVASIQPRHAVDDRDAVDLHWAGGADRAFPYAALHAAGVQLRLGSDAPVAALDPWDAIASAVHRSADARPPWHPEQQLPLDVALTASSGGRGVVRVADVADLVLVAEHPAEVLARGGPAALRATEVLATLVGGEFTHRGAF
ncbi:MAG: amidohydrolase [Janthinobacterium lividum]